MLNRLTNHFSMALPNALRPLEIKVNHVSRIQTSLSQSPQSTKLSLGYGMADMRHFSPPFVQMTQAVNNTYPPVVMPMLSSTELNHDNNKIGRIDIWQEFSKGLFNWWFTVRWDLLKKLPQWGGGLSHQKSTRLLPNKQHWTPDVFVKVLSMPMNQIGKVHLTAPLQDVPSLRDRDPIEKKIITDSSTNISQYPNSLSSALRQVVFPSSDRQTGMHFLAEIAQSASSSPLSLNTISSQTTGRQAQPASLYPLSLNTISSQTIGRQTDFPNRDISSLSKPDPFPQQGELSPTAKTASLNLPAEMPPIFSNIPTTINTEELRAPPAPAPTTLPKSFPTAQSTTTDAAGPKTINVNGGIHVQIAAQTIDRDHAEETARTIAGHVLKEINRISARDRFRRGLPPNR